MLMGPGEHWSDVPTTTDPDGTVRIYIDRNTRAFDDLLGYIEYGKLFLEEIIASGNNNGGGSIRLKRLRLEAGYFTVDSLSEDIDDVMFGDPVSFRSGDWVTVRGKASRDEDDEVVGWGWNNFSGNESIAYLPSKRGISILEVKSTGTYIVFYSLHSVAVTALTPSEGYQSERHDEFCTLGVFHKTMTRSECGHWTYPLVRCGAFDYRTDQEKRRNEPLMFTAACAEPISLREGDELHCQHGTGVETPGAMRRIGDLVGEHTEFPEDPDCVCYITLVRVSGGSVAKWNVEREKEKDEPTIAKWTPGNNDFPTSHPNCASLDTKVQFKKAGFYLILGRVASRLRKDCNSDYDYGERPTVQLELCTKGGTPLHIVAEVVSYPNSSDDVEYSKKMVDYGSINDVIYAEKDSCVSARAVRGACFAGHGCVPVSFGKIPTQSMSAMRLKPSSRVDRYQVSLDNGRLSFERALGGDKSLPEQQEPLFTIERYENTDFMTLEAVMDCQCMVVGSLSSLMGPIATMSINDTAIIHSQLCKESGRGSHSFHGIILLEKNDCIQLKNRGMDLCYDHTPYCGHLAFVVLDS